MITAYYPNSTATTSDYTYDGTASGYYEKWHEDEDDLFYIQTKTALTQDATNDALAKELKWIANIEWIKDLGRIAFYDKWSLPQLNIDQRPLNIYRKMPRCNRHGLGLRIRRDR